MAPAGLLALAALAGLASSTPNALPLALARASPMAQAPPAPAPAPAPTSAPSPTPTDPLSSFLNFFGLSPTSAPSPGANQAAPTQPQPQPQLPTPKPVNPTLPGAFNQSSSNNCADVHIIVARGSNEPAGMGAMGSFAYRLAAALPSTSVEWIRYPAELLTYYASTTEGWESTSHGLVEYVDRCKRRGVVLMGYSQGANVMGDVLCGGGGSLGLGPVTAPVEERYRRAVTAAVLTGDPRHNAGKEWNVGSGESDGLFPRPPNVSCASTNVGSKLRSYCESGDPFCNRGLDLNAHAVYFEKYNNDAFDFVMARLMDEGIVTKKSDGTFTTRMRALDSPDPPSASNGKPSAGGKPGTGGGPAASGSASATAAGSANAAARGGCASGVVAMGVFVARIAVMMF